MRFPRSDQGSGRGLVHDGRQPWLLRRQPLLGPRPARVGSSAGPSPPTGLRDASGSSEPPPAGLGAAPRRRQQARRTGAKLLRFDRELGARWVAGADEAGRGCLAGPLVAAAVLFDHERLTLGQRRALSALNDSKQQTLAAREELYPVILRTASKVSVVSRCVRRIDSHGLHRTNVAALRDALLRVARPGCVCLSDGFPVPATGYEQRAVIDGDARSAAIAAASIVAKVTRDRYMQPRRPPPPGLGVRDPRRLRDPRAPRGDHGPRRLAAPSPVLPVDRVPAARALTPASHVQPSPRPTSIRCSSGDLRTLPPGGRVRAGGRRVEGDPDRVEAELGGVGTASPVGRATRRPCAGPERAWLARARPTGPRPASPAAS